MKTNNVPALVMLTAGFVYCLIGIYYQVALTPFMVRLLIVLIVFYILGGIIRMFLDKLVVMLATKPEQPSENTEGTEEEAEEISEQNDTK